ncbi:hypothetical protein pipiens_006277 [Culex pipiens pipiens]|uniref:Uncharacterized protein n=1 Tax=Culex pipiens pipiens TaxID=38569 RepID=A0ABD1DQF7_CULPP
MAPRARTYTLSVRLPPTTTTTRKGNRQPELPELPAQETTNNLPIHQAGRTWTQDFFLPTFRNHPFSSLPAKAKGLSTILHGKPPDLFLLLFSSAAGRLFARANSTKKEQQSWRATKMVQ